jgi:hypothetical protein
VVFGSDSPPDTPTSTPPARIRSARQQYDSKAAIEIECFDWNTSDTNSKLLSGDACGIASGVSPSFLGRNRTLCPMIRWNIYWLRKIYQIFL